MRVGLLSADLPQIYAQILQLILVDEQVSETCADGENDGVFI